MDGKLFSFDTELFSQPVTVVVGDLNVALNFLREKMSPTAFESTERDMRHCIGYALQADTGVGVHNFIWIEDFHNDEVLFHESLHTAFNILDWVGVPADANSQEALAYLQSWLVKKIRTLHDSTEAHQAPETHSEQSDDKADAECVKASEARYWGCGRAVGRK